MISLINKNKKKAETQKIHENYKFPIYYKTNKNPEKFWYQEKKEWQTTSLQKYWK